MPMAENSTVMIFSLTASEAATAKKGWWRVVREVVRLKKNIAFTSFKFGFETWQQSFAFFP